MSADLTRLRATLTEHGNLDKSTVLALINRAEQAEQQVARVRASLPPFDRAAEYWLMAESIYYALDGEPNVAL